MTQLPDNSEQSAPIPRGGLHGFPPSPPALAKRENNLGFRMGEGYHHCLLIRAEVAALHGVLFLYCAVMTALLWRPPPQ
jgi:hypothetical protein